MITQQLFWKYSSLAVEKLIEVRGLTRGLPPKDIGILVPGIDLISLLQDRQGNG